MSLALDAHLLIIGAGLAGYYTARQMRTQGHTGPITILGAEAHPAYDRPALSKAYLCGTTDLCDLYLDDPADPLDVRWVRSDAVIGLSTEPLGVWTTSGTFYLGDAVVIATGAEARRLGGHAIRCVEDAAALRAAPLAGARVAVIGGGFLALETAATCTTRGAGSVTVIAGEELPGLRRLGQPVAQALHRLHAQHGVRFLGAARALSVTPAGHAGLAGPQEHAGPQGHVITLSDGRRIEADVVISAVGAVPATGWLTRSALALDPETQAVLTDDTGFTGVPGIWAAGDCALWAAQQTGLRPVGHWQETVDQAQALASTLLGGVPSPMQEPYLWSDQHHVTIQAAGMLALADEVQVLAGSIESGDLLVSYLREGTEIGILGMNRLREVVRWRRARRIRPAALAA
ncbi:NAD(P)/FAD-dependent oxidoreductase [Nesterenkonia sp. E16_7]|uniref:NAD(P)/FAD-dependent oxidoreductase n=1 Tax=unclassified Nesterenkonia TaxID=2629769 RepID=UPI001A90F93D|nr:MULTISPECIES: FAD/NAD(P)-binding oxidoreductase [unclassified Nesterenkonia]MBO0594816.1 NAD(P)/FAD-dependent oxidoreductase [Nesterenkonia sp. E16_10]MBO0597065.1 NAD(P)/FAD-dependent oxidoreductase [Nesterenkonia sp. E16_7]